MDGFRAAQILYSTHIKHWKVLCKVRMRWHASGNDGISMTPSRKYSVLDRFREVGGKGFVHQVRWNEADRGIMSCASMAESRWYEAARAFDRILKSPELECWIQLRPGQVLCESSVGPQRHGSRERLAVLTRSAGATT